ncbi:MAG: NAD(P)H-dependent oxidoreductase [Enhydrobacter sp.]|nr:MAG: NAD(P)H-dependent oxidoreductase [Enhydrobacter sp.]
MPRKILILNGHPDASSKGLCHALAEAYAEGARDAGNDVRRIDVAGLDFGFLRSQAEFEKGKVPAAIVAAQQDILWADHLVVVFPLWLGDIPAVLKAFFEQTLRPGFAFDYRPSGLPTMHLKGRSARVIVTMGMPAFVYRWYFRAHGLKNLERNILKFVGIGPVRATLIGGVGGAKSQTIRKRLDEVTNLGRSGF